MNGRQIKLSVQLPSEKKIFLSCLTVFNFGLLAGYEDFECKCARDRVPLAYMNGESEG